MVLVSTVGASLGLHISTLEAGYAQGRAACIDVACLCSLSFLIAELTILTTLLTYNNLLSAYTKTID